jgi:predicted PurR-regulated permease PerM
MTKGPVIVTDSGASGPPGGWSRERVIFLAISGLAVTALLWWARAVLLPFIVAAILAYVLTPLVQLCERVRMPRAVAILVVYLTTFGGIYLAGSAVAPRVYRETARFVHDAPALTRDLAGRWTPRVNRWVRGILNEGAPAVRGASGASRPAFEIEKRQDGAFGVELGSGVEIVQEGPRHWRLAPLREARPEQFSVASVVAESISHTVAYIKLNALELIKFGQRVVSRVARAIFLLFMTLMVAAYLMHTRENIVGFLRSLPPPSARLGFDRLLRRIDRGLAGVVRGQLLICVVNGVLSAIGFWLLGLRYWPTLAIISSIMSIIPIFGSILSAIPVVLIGLTQGFWTALWALLWIVGVHQIEANLLNPKIIGVAARIHPVLVVFALIVGEHYHGLWGAVLAVPALSVLQSIFQHFRYESMPDTGPDSLAPPAVTTHGD